MIRLAHSFICSCRRFRGGWHDEYLTVPALGPLLETASSHDLFKDISKTCVEFAVEHLAAFAKSEGRGQHPKREREI